MKINLDFKKGADAVSGALQKTTAITKKVSSDVQQKTKDLSVKMKDDSYQKRLKKYNPLFPDKYFSEEFNLPNMIEIVDDAVRKGIDVCEGAIGWISTQNGMEVLHLYDEAIKESGISFIPAATCDAVYYVDKFDRNRFIQTDCIFSKAHEERLAELKNIAYSLGAKKCSIEISESTTQTEINKNKKESSAKIPINSVSVSNGAGYEVGSSHTDSSLRLGKIEAEFEGSDDIKEPELKWFAHDDTIKNLVKMRTAGNNSIKSETLILEGAISATMSQKTAFAIDNAISKIGSKTKSSMEKQATKEFHSKMIFVVEF